MLAKQSTTFLPHEGRIGTARARPLVGFSGQAQDVERASFSTPAIRGTRKCGDPSGSRMAEYLKHLRDHDQPARNSDVIPNVPSNNGSRPDELTRGELRIGREALADTVSSVGAPTPSSRSRFEAGSRSSVPGPGSRTPPQ
jgi:hypothetical protein